MNAITTVYRGLRFRSRLEATWACFFDLLQWPWEYEPLDLKGYIPDFVLSFKHESVLVEVKPLTTIDQTVKPSMAQKKLELSGWQGVAMIVGAGLHGPDDVISSYAAIGSINRLAAKPPWTMARIGGCLHCWQTSIHIRKSNWSWVCPLCGVGKLNGLDDWHVGPAPVLLDKLWAQAKNTTQWKP